MKEATVLIGGDRAEENDDEAILGSLPFLLLVDIGDLLSVL